MNKENTHTSGHKTEGWVFFWVGDGGAECNA